MWHLCSASLPCRVCQCGHERQHTPPASEPWCGRQGREEGLRGIARRQAAEAARLEVEREAYNRASRAQVLHHALSMSGRCLHHEQSLHGHARDKADAHPWHWLLPPMGAKYGEISV